MGHHGAPYHGVSYHGAPLYDTPYHGAPHHGAPYPGVAHHDEGLVWWQVVNGRLLLVCTSAGKGFDYY